MKSDVRDPFKNRFITMFNPLIVKGGLIFRQICKSLPEEDFAVVPGWGHLKSSSGKFEERFIKRIVQSLGKEYSGQLPEEVDFSDLRNVVILKPTPNVREIYSQTRVLCIPSQWEEAFGRVAIEAFANGIPVLGSKVGGLKTNINKGGILIKRYKNSDEWINQIKKLRNRAYYRKLSKRGLEFTKTEYNEVKIADDFYGLLRSLSRRSERCP